MCTHSNSYYYQMIATIANQMCTHSDCYYSPNVYTFRLLLLCVHIQVANVYTFKLLL